MGDNSILIPGMTGGQECAQPLQEQDTQYLKKDNYLGEFEDEAEKSLVRENLGVYPKTSVYTQQEADIKSKTLIQEALQQHLSTEDPHGILPQVESKLEGIVKQDGSTPFLSPQTGVDPVSDFHLTTKRFVQKLLNDHLLADDPHNIISKVEDILTSYVKLSQVYLKNQVYTTQEVDSRLSSFIKKDGTTPFTKAQIGVDPLIDSHLSTKRYVDQVMWNHLVDIDPHGFMTTLNQRLANYYKKSETYSKAETYSRIQIDTIIRSLVNNAAAEAIQEHINQFDPHNILPEIRKEGYVKQDGTTPFKTAQKGVEGVEPNDLVILSQLETLKTDLEGKIEQKECVWITSGPVQTTVGFVEDNSEVPAQMTLQEIMDAIFYGKAVDVKSVPIAVVGSIVTVDMYIRGTLGLVHTVELYQNDQLIGTFSKEDFESDRGHHSTNSLPIVEDTTFTLKVYYCTGAVLQDTWLTKVSFGLFVGLLPQWYTGSLITWEYLQQLAKEDSYNNKFYGGLCKDHLETLKHKFNFSSPTDPKHIFVVVPKDYPDLYQMSTPSQQFGLDAFDIIDTIPLKIPELSEDTLYKVYIYKQVLVTLGDVEVTFNFNNE